MIIPTIDEVFSRFLKEGWRLTISWSEVQGKFIASVMNLAPNTPIVEAAEVTPLQAIETVFSNFDLEMQDGAN